MPAYYPPGFTFDRIRQRVSVSQERLRYREDEARAQEAARRAGYHDEEGRRDRVLERAYLRRGRELFEPEGQEAAPRVVDWDEVREKVQRGNVGVGARQVKFVGHRE